ncbi:MAG: right-handed parallel beta-helix repeat-containing protein, partial [Planctomycetes bacterium]|nr:right-handed parallel beta-helix repeat-containing protein [Planctomycetota bacterium]
MSQRKLSVCSHPRRRGQEFLAAIALVAWLAIDRAIALPPNQTLDDARLPAIATSPIPTLQAGQFDPCAVSSPDDLDCNHDGILDFCDLDIGISSDCNNNGIPDECDIADGTSGDCDHNGIPDECWPDCNGNGVPDVCDIVNGDAIDCDGDLVPDNCELAQHPEKDCNQNGIPDLCDVFNGTSADCNRNYVPDECEIRAHQVNDCNLNGIPDSCDIASGASDCDSDGVIDECEMSYGTDCNHNGVYDPCDIQRGTSEDCNQNHIPDECDVQLTGHDCDRNGIVDSCELAAGTAQDCDHDHRIDACAIARGQVTDCNHNGIPDSCDLALDASLDCDGDHVFDSCAIASGLVSDCDRNGVPDSCQFASGDFLDCDGNGVIDVCDIFAGNVEDCNANGIPDECDISSGNSVDENGNGTPDECEGIRRYVSAAAAPGGDGRTWFHAMQNLQDALDAIALRDTDNREIWVSQGTYYPTKRTNPNDPRSATFALVEGVSIRGGFAGPGRPDPNARFFGTTLSGDIDENDSPDYQNYGENVYHVVTASGLADATLDGVTIRGGNANVGSIPCGGGLNIAYAGLHIQSCVFEQNLAGSPSLPPGEGSVAWSNGGGAGICILNSEQSVFISDSDFYGNHTTGTGSAIVIVGGPLEVDNCSFEENGAEHGATVSDEGYASIYIAQSTFDSNHGAGVSGGSVELIGDVFKYNVGSYGGAASLSGNAMVSDCLFEANSAQFGGAISAGRAHLTINNSRFFRNYATNGGSIDLENCPSAKIDSSLFSRNSAEFGGAAFVRSDATFIDCNFSDNYSQTSGGAVQIAGGNTRFEANRFSNNHSEAGGALEIDSGMTSINDCMLSTNHAAFGGAISQTGGEMVIEACTIAANSSNGLGGGVITSGDTTIRNAILWGNVEDPNGGAYTDELAQVEGIRFVDFSHSCVQGWTGTYGDDTNYGDDPMFVDPLGPDHQPRTGDEDYHLSSGSPCINAGANPDPNCGQPNMPPCPPAADLDGRPRILCGTVDIGAYEFGIVGDYNCDQTVDLEDSSNWAACVSGPLPDRRGSEIPACIAFDFDADGDIDLKDFYG